MPCASTLLGICLNPPPADAGSAIFGFAEFVGALALLVLVFNSSDFLYKYRISIAPLPLYRITFIGTIVIGFGALVTDLWFADRWLRSEEHTSELQSLMRISYAVFCLK